MRLYSAVVIRCAAGWEHYSVGVVYYIPFRRVTKGNKLVGLPCGVEYGTI